MSQPIPNAENLFSKDELDKFNAVFPELVRDLTEIPEYDDMPETNLRMSRILQYNVPHGKKFRGLTTVLAYRHMTEETTEENARLARVLGWCVEMSYFLVADDIMDNSETRRGRPCWYKVDNMGFIAANDAILIESGIFQLLKKYFREKKYYSQLLEVMREINHKTLYGQSLDTHTALKRNMESFSMEKYSAIVKYKTSYYSFYLPVRLAMAMKGGDDSLAIDQVRAIALAMGHFFQVQDDYLDCFGDVTVTGKLGTDIQDCKCTWLFVTAAQMCSEGQKKTLLDNYGRDNPESVLTVKRLYEELGLPQKYQEYEDNAYNLICRQIPQMSPTLPKPLFTDLLNQIYRRTR